MEQLLIPNSPITENICQYLDYADVQQASYTCHSWRQAFLPFLQAYQKDALQTITQYLQGFERRYLITNMLGLTCVNCILDLGFMKDEVGWLSLQNYHTIYCTQCWQKLKDVDEAIPIKNNLSHVIGIMGERGIFSLRTPSQYQYRGNFQHLELWIEEFLNRVHLFFPGMVNNLSIRHQYQQLAKRGSLFDWLPVKKYKSTTASLYHPFFPNVYEVFGFEMVCANPENPYYGQKMYIICDTVNTSWYTLPTLLPEGFQPTGTVCPRRPLHY